MVGGNTKMPLGRLKRVPLAVDKMAAETMLNKLVQKVERERAGLVDPTDDQRKRPLFKHISEFKGYLTNKGVTAKQVMETIHKLQRMIDDRKWKFLDDITANAALDFLGQLCRDGPECPNVQPLPKSRQAIHSLARAGSAIVVRPVGPSFTSQRSGRSAS